MRIRAARIEDAPALGRVMVQTWLAAHRGQMSEAAWRKRVAEWTPDVSAQAWARLLTEKSDGEHGRTVLLVAEEESEVVGLVLGTDVEDDAAGATAQVRALYVRQDRQGRGLGSDLLRAAARELAALGFSILHVGVLTANRRARSFYQAMGGREVGQRTFDEEGEPLPETLYEWRDIAAGLRGTPAR